MIKPRYIIQVIVFLLISIHSFGQKKREEKIDTAICILASSGNDHITGVIQFVQHKQGVRIIGDVEGLSPGKHGIHIHEGDSCSAPGGHFNPAGTTHGGPLDSKSHLGDMGNIVADYSGKAHIEFTAARLNLNGKASIVGKPLVIHRDPDDFATQPIGNSGSAIACGIIREPD